MNNLANYCEIKTLLTKRVVKISEKYTYLEKVVDVESIVISYVKKAFENISNQELYLVTENKFIVITWDPFIVKTYNIKDIINTEIELKSRYEISMKITFENGDSIELHNEKDSNPDWKEEYYDYILQLSKHIVNI